jgi:ribosomal protein S27AE
MGELARVGALHQGAPRILIIDIERLPGEVTLDMWHPRDFKRVNYVHPDRWSTLPSTVCYAAKWYGERKVEFVAQWDGGAEAMTRRAWELYDEADAVVTFNGKRFDNKVLASDWVVAGLTPPSPWRDVDLFTVASREFAFESRSLAHLCERLGIAGKSGHYNAAEAKAAAAGDVKAQRSLARYNREDVRATERAYDRLGAWIKDHPHHGLYSGEERSCPRCGSTSLTQHGWHRTAVTAYARMRCDDCGAFSRLTHVKARTMTRPAR